MVERHPQPRSGEEAAPLGDDAFETLMARLGPFETAPHLAVAVSGGADSLCLALLAGRWAAGRGGRVTALTVDHGLRAEAADEAMRVGQWLTPKGLAHHVLRWRGPKPRTGVPAAAREARYELMTAWCREAGVLHLLVAHNRDDQAETLLMRLGSGSGPDGLAAMAAVRETPDVRLLRPLLGVPKAALSQALAAAGQEWIEDPSNDDAAFARVRIRRTMAEGGLDARDLARAAERFGRARVALEAASSELLARSASVHPAGYIRIGFRAFEAAPTEVSLRALGRVLAAVGGRAHGPGLEKLERLHGELMAGTRGISGTLGGCRVVAGDDVLICRETRGIPEPVAVGPGLRLLWDRRFAIRFDGPGHSRESRPKLGGLGHRGWSEIIQVRPDLRGCRVPGPARPSLPALIDELGVIAVPHLGYRRAEGPDPGLDFSEIAFRPPNTVSSVGFFLLNGPDVLSL